MFQDATPEQIDKSLKEAQLAFQSYKNFSGKKKASFLRAIANEMEALGDTLVKTAMEESHLPEGRIIGERGRTMGQLRMNADLVEEGSWVDARIDTAMPDRKPLPRTDLRKMMVPIGPVVVFGASNFPLAYSTAGGDTACALAAGCPVIVKAHPDHAKTSQLVADCIAKAAKDNGIPAGVFHHLHGAGFEVGTALVKHPFTKAVGFTGSFAGGKALFDLANKRPEPIPVFAEMSSINPVILLPESLQKDYDQTASMLVGSITLGAGQFCTNPGLIIAIENDGLKNFISALSKKIEAVAPEHMLNEGIAKNYYKKLENALAQKGVAVEAEVSAGAPQGKPVVASVQADDFLKNPALAEEVFGPFSLIIRCKDIDQFHTVLSHLHGQLTATLIGEEAELAKHQNSINILREKAGRIVINGVPTGVEVCPAMQHGGPFPSSTDSRFTAVGRDSIKRFVRPVCFQNFPNALLPEELKDGNPLGIRRLVNNELQ